MAHGGHPVEAPLLGQPAQLAGRPRPAHRSGAAAARWPQGGRATDRSGRARQRADARSCPSPTSAGGSGSSTQSHWVSSPGGCSIDRVRPSLGRRAGLAVRPQAPGPDLAGERRIRPAVAEPGDLVEQGHRPQVRIFGESFADVVDERLERVVARRASAPRRPARRRGRRGWSCGPGPGAGRSRRSSNPVGATRERRCLPPVSAWEARAPSMRWRVVRDRHLRRSPTRFRWGHGVGNFSEQNWGDSPERHQVVHADGEVDAAGRDGG